MAKTKKAENHGGKRPGAGRKPKAKDTAKDTAKQALQTVKTRGVVIIALGSPHYGKLAANAAASIRYGDKSVKIHLVHSGGSISHLTPAHKSLFTSMSKCPGSFMIKDGKVNYIKAKTCAYQLSPFDETLLIDADLLWFGGKPVSILMDELKAVDFAIQSRGVHDFHTGNTRGKYTHWCNVNEARKAYSLSGELYQLSSEVIWFKKCSGTKKLFGKIEQIYNKPKIKPSVEFAGDLPDELAFNIACSIMDVKPRSANEVFVYWDYMDRKNAPTWQSVLSNYYAFSAGGNDMPATAISRYSQMARAHANALRLPYHFNIYPKRKWDASRKVL
jgi:hypothetical protein